MGVRRVTVIATAVLLILVTGCGRGNDAGVVTIGVTDAADKYWSVFRTLSAKEGIQVSVVGFSDYEQPNAALEDGDLDMNQYQGLLFLAAYNHRAGTDLTPIGATAVYPPPLYSQRHRKVHDIPRGAIILVPNDPTNDDRALRVLNHAGLIALRDTTSIYLDTSDIDRERSTVVVRTIDAYQTAVSLDSVDGAVVHAAPARNAGLRKEWILAQVDPRSESSAKYINAFVVRNADRDSTKLRRLAELFHAPEVVRAFEDDKGNDVAIVRRPAEKLRTLELSLRSQMHS